MNNPIETLLNLYEVDKSKETTDKMAHALENFNKAIKKAHRYVMQHCVTDGILYHGDNEANLVIFGLLGYGSHMTVDEANRIYSGKNELLIQAITEGKGDE